MTQYNDPALLKSSLTFNKCVIMISLKFQKPTRSRQHCEKVCSAPFFLASSLHSENPPPCPRTWCPPAASSFSRIPGALSLQEDPSTSLSDLDPSLPMTSPSLALYFPT